MNCYLRLALFRWTDADVVEFHIAKALGLFDVGTDVTFAGKYKWIWETRNKCSSMMAGIMSSLVDMGVLEHDDVEMTYRWNQSYKMDDVCNSWGQALR